MKKIIKNFDGWNDKKKETEYNIRPFFKEGDVWILSVGENIGDEENGKGKMFFRPVLILKKWNTHFFWGIPLTTQKKQNKFHSFLGIFEHQKSYAILSQNKQFDAKRLYRKMGEIPKLKRMNIKEKLFSLI